MVELFANNGDPDQTPRSAASDLGLHCLLAMFRVSSLQWANEFPQGTKLVFYLNLYWTIIGPTEILRSNRDIRKLAEYILSTNNKTYPRIIIKTPP